MTTTGASRPGSGAVVGPREVPARDDPPVDVPADAARPRSGARVGRRPAAAAPVDVRRRARRVRSVDAFRGGVLALGLATPEVKVPGTYPFLEHAEWLGFTVSDVVFPGFLVAGGASLAFLLKAPVGDDRRMRLVRRFLSLLCLGVLYNVLGQPLDLPVVRLTGVLQLIGIAGGLGAVVILLSRRADGGDRPGVLVGVIATVVAAHGAVLLVQGRCLEPEAFCSPYQGFDAAVLGEGHLYRQGTVGYDPEGLVLSCVAVVFVLGGYLLGRLLRARGTGLDTVWRLLACGGVLAAAGLLLTAVIPLSKRIMTPSFVLLVAGVLATALGVVVLALDTHREGRGGDVLERVRAVVAWPAVTLGWNALVVFLAERALATAWAQSTLADGRTLQTVVYEAVPLVGDRQALGYSAVLLLCVFALTVVMRLLRWRIAL